MLETNRRATSPYIRAIETEYRGFKFRSRLEARWAVFFDSCLIDWKYEPEGFESWIGPQEQKICYLPDFYLPVSNTWVEVKGSDDALLADADKLTAMLDFGSPLPGVDESYGTSHGLLILGDIPEHKWGLVFHPLIQHHKGLWLNWAAFGVPDSPIWPLPERNWMSHYLDLPKLGILDKWTTKAKIIPLEYANGKVMDGYRSARQARFEHGASFDARLPR